MADGQKANGSNYVTVEIYDQVYHLSGQDQDHIRDLASRVDAKMRAVSAQGRTVDSLRVAVLAALNLADELARIEERYAAVTSTGDSVASIRSRAHSLSGMLDEVLSEERKAG